LGKRTLCGEREKNIETGCQEKVWWWGEGKLGGGIPRLDKVAKRQGNGGEGRTRPLVREAAKTQGMGQIVSPKQQPNMRGKGRGKQREKKRP